MKAKLEELAKLGIEFYEKHLKQILEPEHNGEFVAIEPYSKRYFVNQDSTQVALDALAEMPDSKFYFSRIGYGYTHKL